MIVLLGRPTMTRRATLATFISLGLVAAAGAQPSQSLTIGVRSGPESMDPHWSTLGGHIEALRHIFDSRWHPVAE